MKSDGLASVLVALASITAEAADRAADLAAVVQAEREFAARARVVNVRQAFAEYFARSHVRRGIDWPPGQGLASVAKIIPTGELPMNDEKSTALRACLVAVLSAPLAAHATIQVPEPGTLSLLGMGLAAIAIVAARKRRK